MASLFEIAPKLPEALDTVRKLHLFASTEHSEPHSLLSELESKMTDVYLDWKPINRAASLIISIPIDFVYRNLN